MNLITKVLKFFRRKIIIPINTSLIIITFILRKLFLGSQNALLYFSQVDKNALIHLLRLNGASIGNNCDIETGLIFHNCTNLSYLKIGKNCHIGKGCFFDLRDKIEIGDNVVISMLTTFITHLDLNKSNLSNIYKACQKPVTIGNDCYIGVKCTILMGVNIGEKAFIAANSLVNKNVEPYSYVAGVPAKLINNISLPF